MVGIIIAVVGMTGLGQVLALNIMNISQGHLWLALAMIMLAALILGKGLPLRRATLLLLVLLLLHLLLWGSRHWLLTSWPFTTDVCLVLFLQCTDLLYSSGLSGSNPMEVAVSAFRLASAGLIIPFILLLQSCYCRRFSPSLVTVLSLR